jgi:hypothetical protein
MKESGRNMQKISAPGTVSALSLIKLASIFYIQGTDPSGQSGLTGLPRDAAAARRRLKAAGRMDAADSRLFFARPGPPGEQFPPPPGFLIEA